MARQFKAGQLQTGSLYNISASYAVTAAYAMNGGGSGSVTTINTGSFATTGSNTFIGNQTITGNLTINGTASISYLNVSYQSSSIIFSSGSNQLGDATNDTQTLIGTVIVSGSQRITGSLNVSQGITGSLFGTSSNAVSASFASTASFIVTAQTASFVTSSNVFGPNGANSILSSSFATSASRAVSASIATTASYANFAQSSSIELIQSSNLNQSYYPVFVSNQTNNTAQQLYVDSGFGLEYNPNLNLLTTTASLALTASRATTSSFAVTASYALNAGSGGTINTGSFATTGSNIFKGNQVISGSIYLRSGSIIDSIGADIFIKSGVGNNSGVALYNSESTQYLAVDSFGSYANKFTVSGLTTTQNQIISGSGNSALDISNPDTGPWFFQMFNRAYSSNTVFEAGSYDTGDFLMGNSTDRPIKIYINSQYNSPILTITSSGVTIANRLQQGTSTTATNDSAHAEGSGTTAAGQASHAEGSNTAANGQYTHAEGVNTAASGYGSHAEGWYTQTNGAYSHAEGYNTTSSGEYSHAEGTGTYALGIAAHAEGTSIYVQPSPIISLNDPLTAITLNSYSYTVTNSTAGEIRVPGDVTADWPNPDTIVTNLIVTSSNGAVTVDFGYYTNTHIVNGVNFDGSDTILSINGFYGEYHPVERATLTAYGNYSHAEGFGNTATGEASHAEGRRTIAYDAFQHVQGQYNISTPGVAAFIIGNGTDDTNRSNLIFASGSQVQITGSLNSSGSVYFPSLTQQSQNNVVIIDTATGQLFYTASSAFGGGGGGGSGFPFVGNAVITGSLLVSGSGVIVTGSLEAASITGSLQGNVVGDLTGTASRATLAEGSQQVYLTNLLNNDTEIYPLLSYTTPGSGLTQPGSVRTPAELNNFKYNPVPGRLTVTAISASSLTGSLQGTASWARNAQTASIAQTASYYPETDPVFTSKSASFATTGSNTFIGNQTISGSLNLSGSFSHRGDTIHTGSVFHSGSKILNGLFIQTGSLNISGSTTQIGTNTLLGNTTLSGSIIISGSTTNPPTPTIRIYGDMETNGVIKFMPVVKSIDTTISASYIFVSGSTNDLYFSQNGAGYANTTRLRWLESNLYTGLLSGGVIRSTIGSTSFTIESGSGIIVTLNASTSSIDPYPTVQYIQWPTLTQSITNSGSAKITYVGISSAGTVVQQTVPWGTTNINQWDQQIELGVVLHLSGSVSTGVYNSPQVSYGQAQRTDDFVRSFGPLKISGHVLSPSGSTLSLVKSAGTSYNNGSNYTINPNHPSTVSDPAITTSKIYRYYISGSTPVIDTGVGAAGYTVIDPSKYVDTTTGTLNSVPGGQYSIQRVFWIPNSPTNAFLVYYGNGIYNSEVNAQAAIQTEVFTEAPNTAQNAIFLAYVIANGSETNLTNAKIVPAGLFRQVGGIGSTGTTPISTTLASLSDVAITSPTAGDLLTYGGGQWSNGKTITGNYSVNGNLTVTGSIIGTASVATSASYAFNSTTASFANTVTRYTRYHIYDNTVSASRGITYDYNGYATAGTALTTNAWTITRLVITASGAVVARTTVSSTNWNATGSAFTYPQ